MTYDEAYTTRFSRGGTMTNKECHLHGDLICGFTGNRVVWSTDYYREHEVEAFRRLCELYEQLEPSEIKDMLTPIVEMSGCICDLENDRQCICDKQERCPCKRGESYKCGGCY
jgi:hypothetical protein